MFERTPEQYNRVSPRDLFNEGNLLKCYGQLFLELEKYGKLSSMRDLRGFIKDPFTVLQHQCDGSTTIPCLELRDCYGDRVPLWRPLNAREPYPLWFYSQYVDDNFPVFYQDSGELSVEIRQMLYIEHPIPKRAEG